jgi:hypothetical protein
LYHFISLFCLIGAKAQYYPLSPPQSQKFNNDRPGFNIRNLPIRTLDEYWKTIERFEAANGNKTQLTAIVRETGVSGLPMCAASPAFSHPYFFPLDPFHLFYENCMPHFWDMWTSCISKPESPPELYHMSQDIASKLGEEAESAIATLPSSFCGPIRDPYKKRQSQYKIYEWMALVHWYIVPISWELGFNPEVVKNFAIFSNIVEYAMTAVTRTCEDLVNLSEKIILFLEGFESLYVGDDPLKISRCRLCIFQLIHIPHHIAHNGSIRFGSQATCERAIGDIGHGIRSKKSPFKNIVSYKTDKQSAKMVHLFYPTLPSLLSSASKAKPQRACLFKEIPITRKQRREDVDLKAHLQAIESYLEVESDLKLQRWGKCPLPNAVTLTSRLFEVSKKATSRTSRYFEAQLGQVLQPRDQSILDETELEVEKTKPIFGEALAFYTVADTDLSLVVYHPLIECHKLFGRWYGKWSSMACVLEMSKIVSLIGIWTFNDHVHILRRHPGLNLLTLDECGIDSEDPLNNVE